jgi:hypothetical protein
LLQINYHEKLDVSANRNISTWLATEKFGLALPQTADGFDYLDPAQFRETSPPTCPRSQVLIADANFKAVITTTAWRSKPRTQKPPIPNRGTRSRTAGR